MDRRGESPLECVRINFGLNGNPVVPMRTRTLVTVVPEAVLRMEMRIGRVFLVENVWKFLTRVDGGFVVRGVRRRLGVNQILDFRLRGRRCWCRLQNCGLEGCDD